MALSATSRSKHRDLVPGSDAYGAWALWVPWVYCFT